MTKLKTLFTRAWLELEVKDKSGKTITRRRQSAHSWVRNFYNMLFGNAACAASGSATGLACVDTGGNTRCDANSVCSVDGYGIQGYNSGLGGYVRGIQVGSGDLAWDFDQYSLQTVIAHGTGLGQLSCQGVRADFHGNSRSVGHQSGE